MGDASFAVAEKALSMEIREDERSLIEKKRHNDRCILSYRPCLENL